MVVALCTVRTSHPHPLLLHYYYYYDIDCKCMYVYMCPATEEAPRLPRLRVNNRIVSTTKCLAARSEEVFHTLSACCVEHDVWWSVKM
jgi:hypothetical protein